MTLAPGTKLGPYEILSPLGAGGMGEVMTIAGRGFVESYVEYTHYVERLHADATSAAAPHAHGEQEAAPAHKH